MDVMFVGLTVGIHLMLPVLFIGWIGFSRYQDRIRWIATTAVFVSFLAMLHLGGAGWHWVGWFWPYVFWALGLGAMGWFLFKQWSDLPWLPQYGWKPWVGVAFSVALVVFFGSGIMGIIDGQQPPEQTVELEFPLDGGHFYVAHGGSTQAVNHHVGVDAQRYALDIVELDNLGIRARWILPEDLEAYKIWGATLRAPCGGEVVDVEAERRDLPPTVLDEDRPMGNFVSIYCEDVDATVVMAHLQQESVAVDIGEDVEVGDSVGEVGNSGNTTEPHLHLHAVEGRVDDRDRLGWEATGVAMELDGRFLVRTDRVDRR